MHSLQRILHEDAYESPFDSFYTPTIGNFVVSSNEWFSLKPTNATLELDAIGSQELEDWSYYLIQVPLGIVGAILTMELRHIQHIAHEIFARHEGIPTTDQYDFQAKSTNEPLMSESLSMHEKYVQKTITKLQLLNGTIQLKIIFPFEGIWCIGVRVINGDHVLVNGGVSKMVSKPMRKLPLIPSYPLFGLSLLKPMEKACKIAMEAIAEVRSKFSFERRSILGSNNIFPSLGKVRPKHEGQFLPNNILIQQEHQHSGTTNTYKEELMNISLPKHSWFVVTIR